MSAEEYHSWATSALAAAGDDAAARDAAESHLEVAAFYTTYQRLLGEAGLVDFGDQIHRTLALLRSHATSAGT